MAILFPSNPSIDDTYTSGGTKYVWNGSGWRSQRPVPVISQIFDINTPPSSPHAMDDEFDGEALDTVKWKTPANGTPTGWTLREGCALNTTVNGSPSVIMQDIADASWKVRMAVSIPRWFSGPNQVCSFTVYRSANGRSFDFGHWSNGANSQNIIGNNFSGTYSAWNGVFYSGSYSNDAGVYSYLMNYWEFESNGTSLTWRWSNTGHEKSWRGLTSHTYASWLGAVPDKFGIWVGGIPVAMIDWIRRIS